MMTSPVVFGRAAAFSLGLIQSFTIIYTCTTDGSPFRKELLTPWMGATLIDFYILITLIAAWVWYKESTWARRLVWITLLFCFGRTVLQALFVRLVLHKILGVGICFSTSMAAVINVVTASWYVAIEFFKLAVDDPVHLVLLKDRHNRKGG